jgi:hypothetical protein
MNLKPLKEQEIVHQIKKNSVEWYNELYPNGEMTIIDPDGWDRRNFHYSYYEELITSIEFIGRMMTSTCSHEPRPRIITGTTE